MVYFRYSPTELKCALLIGRNQVHCNNILGLLRSSPEYSGMVSRTAQNHKRHTYYSLFDPIILLLSDVLIIKSTYALFIYVCFIIVCAELEFKLIILSIVIISCYHS